MKKPKRRRFTVYYDQTNRTNYQVLAHSPEDAEIKADRLWSKKCEVPSATVVEEGWLVEEDGIDR